MYYVHLDTIYVNFYNKNLPWELAAGLVLSSVSCYLSGDDTLYCHLVKMIKWAKKLKF